MARWPDSSIDARSPGDGVSPPVVVVYSPDHRVSVPKPVIAALSGWLEEGSARQDIVCEMAQPGVILVHPDKPLRLRIEAAIKADPDRADSLRLVFASGSFVLNSLRLHDRAALHLFGGPVPDLERETAVTVRAVEDRIELRTVSAYQARHQQAIRDVEDFARR